MKTVYLDNNAYAGFVEDKDAYRLLLSLSRSRKGFLSFESGPGTYEEFSLLWQTPGRDGRYVQMVRDARRLMRRDRFFHDVPDLYEREAEVALGRRRSTSLWYHRRSTEVRWWRTAWRELCNGRPVPGLVNGIRKTKADYEKTFEPAREATLRRAKEEQYNLGEVVGLAEAIRRVRIDAMLGFAAELAKDTWPDLLRLPDPVPSLVETSLHALRTFVCVLCGFALARISACAAQLDPGRSMKGQGKHVGGEFYDIRHAVYGRYVDYFVSEDGLLRFIINSLAETNYAGLPYRALSLPEFLDEARQIAAR